MHNFTIIKKGFSLVLLGLSMCSFAYGQVKDTSTYSTDTTTVRVTQKKIVGEKVTGRVVDGFTNKPVVGVKVTVVGFSGNLTDDKGRFNIVVPDFNATLAISTTGYHTKLVPVRKRKAIEVKIYPETFNSVYVDALLPTGEQSMARTSAAINTVNTQGGWTANSESIDSYFQGRIAGVNAIRRSGTPGIGANLFVRGFNSLYASNQPLYVVDGMIYDANSYGTSLTSGHYNNPLQFIDIHDIESVSIIKDAAGAAIYGTKAANGVVIITTNHAQDLDTKIDFGVYGGFNSQPRQLQVMKSDDFRSYLSDALASKGLNSSQIAALPFMNDNPDPVANPYYAIYHNNTNWQDEVFRNSFDQTYFLKVSGGDNIAKYVLSAGYSKDKGVIKETDNTKYQTRFNSDLNLTKKLTGSTNLSFTYTEQRLKDQGLAPATNPIFLSLVKSPFVSRNDIDSRGAVSPNFADADSLGVSNPSALINDGLNLKKAYRFFGSVNFDYTFNKNFKLSNLSGLTYDKTQETLFVPKRGVSPVVLPTALGENKLGTQVIRYFSVFDDLRLHYDKTFNKNHKIHAALGMRYMQSESEQDYAIGYNAATDELISIGNGSVALRTFGGGIGKWRSINTYLTGDYSYKDRYIFNVSGSVDGSSRFGKNNMTAVLPAASAAWIVSSEKFMRSQKVVDLLKLRVSYGLVGNDDIGNYNNSQYYVSQNLLGLQGLVRGNIANSNIQWEQIAKFNIGTDASFFNERLSLSFDFWNNKTDKMITYQTVNSIGGLDSYVDNNAAMKTSGIDFGLNALIINKIVKWNAGVTVSTAKNEVTSLPNNKAILTNYAGGSYITSVGQAANLFYGQRVTGVYATSAEASAAGLSVRNSSGALVPFKAGDAKFIDTNGDKVIDDADRTVIGNPSPDVYGSFNNTFSYKNWSLDALFTFVAGNDIYNYTRSVLESGSSYYNQADIMRNRWRGESQVTNVPKASYGDPMGNAGFSDRWIEDGSYFRLRTLSLTYNVPLKSKAIKYAKVYATGNNLFTLTDYLGYDPEFNASGSIYTQGVDTTLEPQFRSVQLGVRIGL